MKKSVFYIVIAIIVLSLTACNGSMKRDVKRLAHKTEKCFSMVDITDPDMVPSDEFNDCYEELEELMEEYDKKYSDPEASAEFGRLYLEELKKSDLPQEMKDLYSYIYDLGNNEVGFEIDEEEMPDGFDNTLNETDIEE